MTGHGAIAFDNGKMGLDGLGVRIQAINQVMEKTALNRGAQLFFFGSQQF